MSNNYHPSTNAIRAGYTTTNEQEHSEAMFLTSSFVFKDAEQAEKRFSKEQPGNIYARFTNPTVNTFEKRLAAIEGAEACIATASGMAAIFSTLMTFLKQGDHFIASRDMFGTTVVLLNNIITQYGIELTVVDPTDLSSWREAIKPNTKLLLVETPSNPLGRIADMKGLGEIAKANNCLLAVDSLIPTLQRPLELGADIVLYSVTKYIDGQGRCLAGAILTNAQLAEQVMVFLRSTGASLSAFNAWVLLKGLETLDLRMQQHCRNAVALAHWLEQQENVSKVYYLGLPAHEQHELAKQQQSGFGGIVSFVIKGGKEAAFKIINSTRLLSITANLGDTKTTITHPSTTTHCRLSDEQKCSSQIEEGLIRISVGLEHIDDIINDINV